MSVVAIVTARRDSKRLPRKNVRLLNGRPLVAYSIEAGLTCPEVSETWVTTDDPEVATIATNMNAKVLRRPQRFCTDSASSYDAVAHALRSIEANFEYVALLQPTSPLRNAFHLSECINQFRNDKNARSLMSVCTSEHSPYKMLKANGRHVEALFREDQLNVPSQQLPTTYRQNGAIYLMKCVDFLAADHFFVPPVLAYPMDARFSFDIDTELDLVIAEKLMQIGHKQFAPVVAST
jgi:CMP-N-acetylneuraminic acid synthetase